MDSVVLELRTLFEIHKCFKQVKDKGELTPDYKYIPLIWVFAVKYDGRHRARCVGGGHVTDDPEEDFYSGAVDFESVRIAFVVAVLTALQVIAADVGSAYIQALTAEKVYTIAGPEWKALGLEGAVLIVYKALYGLKTSGAMWHQRLASNLCDMKFYPCVADHGSVKKEITMNMLQ